jgi:transcription elongation factor GreA
MTAQEAPAAAPLVTLGHALSEYLQTLKPEQRRIQETYVRKYVEYAGDSLIAATLTGSKVESYAEAQIRVSDPAAPERVAALKAWFQFLRKREYTTANFGINIRARRAIGRSAATAGQRIEETPIEMTADGVDALKSELQVLDSQKLDLIKAIEIARSDGDLRENAPYHAAREALAFANQRHKQIETSLRRAVVVDRTEDDRSNVGSLVTVTNLDDDRQTTYRLVSAREAKAAELKISVESPVGKQLLGRRAGDEVAVSTPRGEFRYRIDSVSNAG